MQCLIDGCTRGLRLRTAVLDCNTRNRTGPGNVDPEADSTVSRMLVRYNIEC